MMNLLEPNKGIVSVLIQKKSQQGKGFSQDGEESGLAEEEGLDPQAGMIEASKELISSIEKKNPERFLRAFKALVFMANEEEGSEENSQESE